MARPVRRSSISAVFAVAAIGDDALVGAEREMDQLLALADGLDRLE